MIIIIYAETYRLSPWWRNLYPQFDHHEDQIIKIIWINTFWLEKVQNSNSREQAENGNFAELDSSYTQREISLIVELNTIISWTLKSYLIV